MPEPEDVRNHAGNHVGANEGQSFQIGSVSGGMHFYGGERFGTLGPDGGLPYIDVSPPVSERGLVHRDGLIERVVQALREEPGAHLLHGPAGAGASAAAASVAGRVRRELGWQVYWIRPRQRLHGLLGVACRLRGHTGEKAAKFLRGAPADGIAWAREVIGDHGAPVLIVIDDADGGPQGNGAEAAAARGWEHLGGACRVLLTGRSGAARAVEGARRHTVDPLAPGAAYAFLHERVPPRDAAEGRALEAAVRACRGLPKRLHAVASGLAEGEHRPEGPAVWWRRLDGLTGEPAAGRHQEVLQLLAAVEADRVKGGVPRRWCAVVHRPDRDSPSAAARLDFSSAEFLEERGLVTVRGTGPDARVAISPGLGAALRCDMRDGQASALALDALDFWSGHEVEQEWEAFTRIADRYAGVPGVLLRADVGRGLVALETPGRRRVRQAEDTVDRVLRRMKRSGAIDPAPPSERSVSDDHLRVWYRAWTALAWVTVRRGRWPEAVGTIKAVAADQGEDLGPDHPDTLRSEALLGGILKAAYQDEEAEDVYRRIRERQVRGFGEEHYLVLAARFDLALARAMRGEFSGARADLGRLAERCEGTLGAGQPFTRHVRGAEKWVAKMGTARYPAKVAITFAGWTMKKASRYVRI